MQNLFNKNKSLEETFKEARIKEYINKYIQEHKRHFDVSDSKMRSILYKVYQDLSPFNLIKNWISMLKSKYIKQIKLKEKINGD